MGNKCDLPTEVDMTHAAVSSPFLCLIVNVVNFPYLQDMCPFDQFVHAVKLFFFKYHISLQEYPLMYKFEVFKVCRK